MPEKQLILKPGRDKSLKRRHQWIFSGAVAEFQGGDPEPGETVAVVDAAGKFLAWAACSPASQLVARVWSFDEEETIDAAFFRKRLEKAIALRHTLGLDDPEGGARLVNAEGDDLPGVVVDRYRDFYVLQLTSAGADRYRDELVAALAECTGAAGIYERSDAAVRTKEGLPPRHGLVFGAEPPNPLIIREGEARYAVDLRHGQKSGFYFDQRRSREVLARYAKERRILNAFSYTGAFAVAGLLAGARHVTNVDSSEPALRLAAHNLEMNKFRPDQWENRAADVPTLLRELCEAGEKFDLVILDPPKFIDSQHAMTRGCRAYQDLARLGFKLLNSGGLLLNFSCSGLMTPELFQKITADAALDAKCEGRIIRRLEQSPDHPTGLATPETFYLKGLMVEKL